LLGSIKYTAGFPKSLLLLLTLTAEKHDDVGFYLSGPCCVLALLTHYLCPDMNSSHSLGRTLVVYKPLLTDEKSKAREHTALCPGSQNGRWYS
jgi:hypothetical protein